MDLPSDLSEGWWWAKWEWGKVQPVYVSASGGRWMVRSGDSHASLDVIRHRWTAMERVAPPSWAKGETDA